jgi:inner membrane protein
MEISNQPANRPGSPTMDFLHSTTGRIIMVGLLTLILLIPLEYVKSLIYERSQMQRKIDKTLNSQWGGPVYVYGPVLKVPYKWQQKTEYAYFFPEKLDISADVKTVSKRRDMYETAVFNAKMKFSGNYTSPNFSAGGINPENVYWERATLLLNTGDIKGIKDGIAISLNGRKYAFEPFTGGTSSDSLIMLETKPFNAREAFGKGEVPFSLDISYDGTRTLDIVPTGKITTAKIVSNWATPVFNGYFSTENENITNRGFTADWKVSHLNRPFAQQYFGRLPDLKPYSFNVNFSIPANEYQQNERAARYGFLVIGLTFLVFFLIQGLSKISIHIFQYTMIGLALIMFYTLLISITEHSSFSFAYIIAGLSVVTMITLYSVSILKDRKFPMFIGASLTALYSFIYVIIQMEHYALLAGSIGLFLILGAVMYFSRKIDWSK